METSETKTGIFVLRGRNGKQPGYVLLNNG
jgi:hypothetical protein